jgi:hypothetical protein
MPSSLRDGLYQMMSNAMDWQASVRKGAGTWIISIALAATYILASKYSDGSLPPAIGLALVFWSGILGLLPVIMSDLRNLDIFRKSVQIEICRLESSVDWMVPLSLGLPQKGYGVISSILGYAYLIIVSVMLALAGLSVYWAWFETGVTSVKVFALFHPFFILGLYLYLRCLLRWNANTVGSFQTGEYTFRESQLPMWASSWGQYTLALKRLDVLTRRLGLVRMFANRAFMVASIAVSVVLSSPEDLLFTDRYLTVAAACVVALLVIFGAWAVDVFGYQKHVTSLVTTLTELEDRYVFLPQIGHNMLTSLSSQTVPIALLSYYFFMQILLVVLGIVLVISPWSIVSGAAALILCSVFSLSLLLIMTTGSKRFTVFSSLRD